MWSNSIGLKKWDNFFSWKCDWQWNEESKKKRPKLTCKIQKSQWHGFHSYFLSCPWDKGVSMSVSTISSRWNIPCSLVYFQDIQSRKVSPSISKVKSFWGHQGKAGRQRGQGIFWWTCGLTMELSLEYLFPSTCWLPVW